MHIFKNYTMDINRIESSLQLKGLYYLNIKLEIFLIMIINKNYKQ